MIRSVGCLLRGKRSRSKSEGRSKQSRSKSGVSRKEAVKVLAVVRWVGIVEGSIKGRSRKVGKG